MAIFALTLLWVAIYSHRNHHDHKNVSVIWKGMTPNHAGWGMWTGLVWVTVRLTTMSVELCERILIGNTCRMIGTWNVGAAGAWFCSNQLHQIYGSLGDVHDVWGSLYGEWLAVTAVMVIITSISNPLGKAHSHNTEEIIFVWCWLTEYSPEFPQQRLPSVAVNTLKDSYDLSRMNTAGSSNGQQKDVVSKIV